MPGFRGRGRGRGRQKKREKTASEKAKYAENKAQAVRVGTAILEEEPDCRGFLPFLRSMKKKDDTMDAFLQGIYAAEHLYDNDVDAAAMNDADAGAGSASSL